MSDEEDEGEVIGGDEDEEPIGIVKDVRTDGDDEDNEDDFVITNDG